MHTTCDLVEYLNLYLYNMGIAKFFHRKKRELCSNSSVDEAATKKQHEESLNNFMGLDKDGVFTQGLESLEYVKVPWKFFQNLEKKTCKGDNSCC